MLNDSILEKYNCLSDRLKAIVAWVDADLKYLEYRTIDTFIATVPHETVDRELSPLNFSFYNTPSGNLVDYFSCCKAKAVFDGFGMAGKCFLIESGLHCDWQTSSFTSESPQMGIITVPQVKTTIYLLQANNEDDFSSLYISDDKYFNFLLGENLEDDDLNTGYTPTPTDILLTYNFLRYCRPGYKNIFVVISTGFNYQEGDFSLAAKRYFKRTIELTIETIHAQCSDPILDDMDLVPYTLFFSKYTDKQNVDSIVSQMEQCISRHSFNIQNVGRLINQNLDRLVTLFAFSSNYHIGTQYRSHAIAALENEYAHFPKPIFNTFNKYKNPANADMFVSLSEAASKHLSILKREPIIKCLITSEWLYSSIGYTEGFDNTFICFGYLKLVEMLLSDILVRDYAGEEFSLSPVKVIAIDDQSENMMMLGNMIRFVLYNPVSPASKNKFWRKIKQTLNEWKNQIRNGYFHKDILNADDVIYIRNKTLEVIYIILGILPK